MPTYADLGPLLAQGLDRERVRVVRVPEFLTWAIAAYFEIAARIQGTPSILNFDKARENSAGSWTCSPEKAARQLGFRPAKSLRERFRETGQWYLEHGWL
jgi:nucleoside-diphosphate-sugar epimerase